MNRIIMMLAIVCIAACATASTTTVQVNAETAEQLTMQPAAEPSLVSQAELTVTVTYAAEVRTMVVPPFAGVGLYIHAPATQWMIGTTSATTSSSTQTMHEVSPAVPAVTETIEVVQSSSVVIRDGGTVEALRTGTAELEVLLDPLVHHGGGLVSTSVQAVQQTITVDVLPKSRRPHRAQRYQNDRR